MTGIFLRFLNFLVLGSAHNNSNNNISKDLLVNEVNEVNKVVIDSNEYTLYEFSLGSTMAQTPGFTYPFIESTKVDICDILYQGTTTNEIEIELPVQEKIIKNDVQSDSSNLNTISKATKNEGIELLRFIEAYLNDATTKPTPTCSSETCDFGSSFKVLMKVKEDIGGMIKSFEEHNGNNRIKKPILVSLATSILKSHHYYFWNPIYHSVKAAICDIFTKSVDFVSWCFLEISEKLTNFCVGIYICYYATRAVIIFLLHLCYALAKFTLMCIFSAAYHPHQTYATFCRLMFYTRLIATNCAQEVGNYLLDKFIHLIMKYPKIFVFQDHFENAVSNVLVYATTKIQNFLVGKTLETRKLSVELAAYYGFKFISQLKKLPGAIFSAVCYIPKFVGNEYSDFVLSNADLPTPVAVAYYLCHLSVLLTVNGLTTAIVTRIVRRYKRSMSTFGLSSLGRLALAIRIANDPSILTTVIKLELNKVKFRMTRRLRVQLLRISKHICPFCLLLARYYSLAMGVARDINTIYSMCTVLIRSLFVFYFSSAMGVVKDCKTIIRIICLLLARYYSLAMGVARDINTIYSMYTVLIRSLCVSYFSLAMGVAKDCRTIMRIISFSILFSWDIWYLLAMGVAKSSSKLLRKLLWKIMKFVINLNIKLIKKILKPIKTTNTTGSPLAHCIVPIMGNRRKSKKSTSYMIFRKNQCSHIFSILSFGFNRLPIIQYIRDSRISKGCVKSIEYLFNRSLTLVLPVNVHRPFETLMISLDFSGLFDLSDSTSVHGALRLDSVNLLDFNSIKIVYEFVREWIIRRVKMTMLVTGEPDINKMLNGITICFNTYTSGSKLHIRLSINLVGDSESKFTSLSTLKTNVPSEPSLLGFGPLLKSLPFTNYAVCIPLTFKINYPIVVDTFSIDNDVQVKAGTEEDENDKLGFTVLTQAKNSDTSMTLVETIYQALKAPFIGSEGPIEFGDITPVAETVPELIELYGQDFETDPEDDGDNDGSDKVEAEGSPLNYSNPLDLFVSPSSLSSNKSDVQERSIPVVYSDTESEEEFLYQLPGDIPVTNHNSSENNENSFPVLQEASITSLTSAEKIDTDSNYDSDDSSLYVPICSNHHDQAVTFKLIDNLTEFDTESAPNTIPRFKDYQGFNTCSKSSLRVKLNPHQAIESRGAEVQSNQTVEELLKLDEDRKIIFIHPEAHENLFKLRCQQVFEYNLNCEEDY